MVHVPREWGTEIVRPNVLLFDIGGVLVDWVGIRAVFELTRGRMDVDSARKFWLTSPWIRKFERGLCGPEEFCAGMAADLDVGLSPEQFREQFTSWDRGPFPGALELLDQLRPQFTLACLSNNNPIHWNRLRNPECFGGRFDHYFVSFETGLMKPDRGAYEHVFSILGVPPNKALFFDDSIECISGAEEVGIRGHLVRGIPEVIRALESEGINIDVTGLGLDSVQRADLIRGGLS